MSMFIPSYTNIVLLQMFYVVLLKIRHRDFPGFQGSVDALFLSNHFLKSANEIIFLSIYTYRDSFDSSCFRADRLWTNNFTCCRIISIVGSKVDFSSFGSNNWNVHSRMDNCGIPTIDDAFGLYDSFWWNILFNKYLFRNFYFFVLQIFGILNLEPFYIYFGVLTKQIYY